MSAPAGVTMSAAESRAEPAASLAVFSALWGLGATFHLGKWATWATTPANLAPVFATGFGPDHLLTNDFRLAYLQDAENNPDGSFPTVSDGLPPADPAHPLRRALKTNDQRAWTPTAPVLLCGGHADPAVLYRNTVLMQDYWSTAPSAPSSVRTDAPSPRAGAIW